jgi:hypothetical protein
VITVPDPVRIELERLDGRWRQLPLDQAFRAVPAVRALVQALADEVAAARGMPPAPVPDLGPAVVLDQLRVMAFDAVQASLDHLLAERLADLRRTLA